MDRRGVDVVVNAAGIMILRPRTFATDRTVYASVAVPIDGAVKPVMR